MADPCCGPINRCKELDDLIYNFLLQAGYPRASIIFDFDLLDLSKQTGTKLKTPAFVIVDPETADPLAVIDVVDAVDSEALKSVAIQTGAYASKLAGKLVQGFVIRVDVQGKTEGDQVQFYRIWPNSTLQRLSSKNFPDMDALRVSRMLMANSTAKAVASASDVIGLRGVNASDEQGSTPSSRGVSAGLYLPALALLVLILLDALLTSSQGQAWLTVPQSILALGAAILLTLPAAIRYGRG